MKTLTRVDCIQLRGVRVHNLKSVDVDIPLNQLTVITGVSGSGKSSLAFDTLFVEGQRRYIDSFSASARQHLDRLEKPDVDDISRIPAAVAIRQVSTPPALRSTVSTATEIQHYLEMLFVRRGQLFCPACDVLVTQHDSSSIANNINELPLGSRCQLGFRIDLSNDSVAESCQELVNRGFSRAVLFDDLKKTRAATTTLNDLLNDDSLFGQEQEQRTVIVIVDRIVVGKTESSRLTESIEACLNSQRVSRNVDETDQPNNSSHCVVLYESSDVEAQNANATTTINIDDKPWKTTTLSTALVCSSCSQQFRTPHARDLNFRSPAGMCGTCRGAGSITELDLNRVIPDRSKTISEGALAIFADEKWAKDKEKVLAFIRDQGIAVDQKVEQLSHADIELLVHGDPTDDKRQGIQAFLNRIERRAQTHELATFLAQWRNVRVCSDCNGSRLNTLARAMRLPLAGEDSAIVAPLSLPQFTEFSIDDALVRIQRLRKNATDVELAPTRHLLEEIENRLEQLSEIGLGYLGLDRSMRSLSSGESRRIELASVMGSPLVHSLFVLDEPSAGLHSNDMEPVIETLHRLRDVGNTVVIVEHDRRFIDAADYCIDIGPLAGQNGGEVVYSGSIDQLADCEESLTAKFCGTRRNQNRKQLARITDSTHWIELRDARFHHLNVSLVRFPLDCLCVVTGVSGSGKSSLVEHVLYPALCESLSQPCSVLDRGTWASLTSVAASESRASNENRLEQINDVQFVDDSPLGRNARSNAATWLDVFPAIRSLFAETQDAQENGFTAGHFSFNSDKGGRCEECDGAGQLEVDMQFLADVVMTCPGCSGSRYRPEILEVTWRTRSIADVLAMTSAEAFAFFRGQPKIQRRLQSLKEVGLEYLTLGQPLSTLSGGEAQRLKLAACLSATKKRSLILLSEPTKGLHPADVKRLIDCFDRLIAVGHSLIVIEHDEDVIQAADHQITLGPGPGPRGGRVLS
jgi:excinuclease ABC subunit A